MVSGRANSQNWMTHAADSPPLATLRAISNLISLIIIVGLIVGLLDMWGEARR